MSDHNSSMLQVEKRHSPVEASLQDLTMAQERPSLEAQKEDVRSVVAASEAPQQTPQELVKSVRRSAMDLLARREYSTVELQRKLLVKFSAYEIIDQELTRLTCQGLLSDERFAEAYSRYRSGAGFGPSRILLELRQKGVKDELSKQAIKKGGFDWYRLVKFAKEKKFGSEVPTENKEKARQVRFLQYRGFTTDQIAELYPS
jgi:regulatory protein